MSKNNTSSQGAKFGSVLRTDQNAAMTSRRIVVVGSANTDMVVRVDELPRPGETVLGGRFAVIPGGKGANQAVAAARAGGRVSFVGRVGGDAFGQQALRGLKREGIDVRSVKRDVDAPSGIALIMVGATGENSIAVAPGANARLRAADVTRAASRFVDSAIVLLQLEIPLDAITAAARLARRQGARVILNPAPARSLPRSLLKLVSILTPNESETESLTGIRVTNDRSALRAARWLHDQGVETVMITRGAQGVFVSSSSGTKRIPAFRVKAVDTTAAGDVFNGSLATALADGASLHEAALFANAAAALSVTRRGAQPSAPLRSEIVRLQRASLRGSAPR